MIPPREATAREAELAVARAKAFEPVTVVSQNYLMSLAAREQANLTQPWRVGDCGNHVFQGDRPVATFHDPIDAEMVVQSVNQTPVPIIDVADLCLPVQIHDVLLVRIAREIESVYEMTTKVSFREYAEAAMVALIESGYVIVPAPPGFNEA